MLAVWSVARVTVATRARKLVSDLCLLEVGRSHDRLRGWLVEISGSVVADWVFVRMNGKFVDIFVKSYKIWKI